MGERKQGNPRFTVHVEEILKEKNPALHKKLPRFAIRWFEKLIYQEPLNVFLNKYGHLDGKDFTDGMAEHLNLKLEVRGWENIPDEGRFTFASNHPLGGLDGMMLVSVIARKFPDFKFLVNDILMNVLNLKDTFLPINKHGAQARDAAAYINEIFASDKQICIFPAGLVSRKQHGEIKDLQWQKNFINKSIQHKRDVIPLYVSGQNSKFFYWLANFRKRIGIKVNIEMLFLPSEMLKYTNRTMVVTFGKPIKYETFDRSKSQLEWADYVKDIVYKLGKQ